VTAPRAARTGLIALAVICAVGASLAPLRSRAVPLDLGTVTCAKYENEVLTSDKTDPIDTVMWLFGFSIAKSGDRVMYGDSLKSFGFALDAECKNNPASTLLESVTAVKSKRENPMDLTRLDCATFAPRHVSLRKSDPESANTLAMWMFGYAVGLSGDHMFDSDALAKFDAALLERCNAHPQDSLFDALSAPNPAIPRIKPKRAAPKPASPGSPAPALPSAPGAPAQGAGLQSSGNMSNASVSR
jgi:hypothetical protein